jgi:hypothetical protein
VLALAVSLVFALALATSLSVAYNVAATWRAAPAETPTRPEHEPRPEPLDTLSRDSAFRVAAWNPGGREGPPSCGSAVDGARAHGAGTQRAASAPTGPLASLTST